MGMPEEGGYDERASSKPAGQQQLPLLKRAFLPRSLVRINHRQPRHVADSSSELNYSQTRAPKDAVTPRFSLPRTEMWGEMKEIYEWRAGRKSQ